MTCLLLYSSIIHLKKIQSEVVTLKVMESLSSWAFDFLAFLCVSMYSLIVICRPQTALTYSVLINNRLSLSDMHAHTIDPSPNSSIVIIIISPFLSRLDSIPFHFHSSTTSMSRYVQSSNQSTKWWMLVCVISSTLLQYSKGTGLLDKLRAEMIKLLDKLGQLICTILSFFKAKIQNMCWFSVLQC